MTLSPSARQQAERLKHGDTTLADFTCAGIVLSDRASRGEYQDKAGPALDDVFRNYGAIHILATHLVPDESEALVEAIYGLQAEGVHLIITSGGTGLGPRDITPETLLGLGDKEVPGLAELIRAHGAKYTPTSFLSRSVAVIYRETLIVALPGNPKAIGESFEVLGPILPHALATMLKGS
jgi:molybdenum cofactor synthesis domain-containing protein